MISMRNRFAASGIHLCPIASHHEGGRALYWPLVGIYQMFPDTSTTLDATREEKKLTSVQMPSHQKQELIYFAAAPERARASGCTRSDCNPLPSF